MRIEPVSGSSSTVHCRPLPGQDPCRVCPVKGNGKLGRYSKPKPKVCDARPRGASAYSALVLALGQRQSLV